jgi:hypothetical protein
MKLNQLTYLFLYVFVVLFFATGCGSKGKGLQTEYVEGVITLDGIPLEGASVQFSPISDAFSTNPAPGQPEMANGLTDKNGKYTLSSINGDVGKGAIAGEYRVLVTKIEATTVESDKAERSVSRIQTAGTQIVTTQKDLIPVIYRDRKKSPLTYTVIPGKNFKVDFDLKPDTE